MADEIDFRRGAKAPPISEAAMAILAISRRDYFMAHIAAAELARHPPDHALYLPDIVGRAAQLATLLMRRADENHG